MLVHFHYVYPLGQKGISCKNGINSRSNPGDENSSTYVLEGFGLISFYSEGILVSEENIHRALTLSGIDL